LSIWIKYLNQSSLVKGISITTNRTPYNYGHKLPMK
jgi:hypothetical protein